MADEKPEAQPAEEPERKMAPLSGARLRLAESMRVVYTATAPVGTLLEDILNPAWWATYSARLKPWDKVEVRVEDGSWYAEVMVLDSSRAWTKVHLMGHVNLTTGDISMVQQERMAAMASVIAAHEITYRGSAGWSVIRKSDRAVVHENAASREDAQGWLRKFAFENPPLKPEKA